MSRDCRLYLDDIREACGKTSRYAAGLTEDELAADEKTLDAVLRNLTIIGEAVKQIPQEVRDLHPQVEWRKIGRFRDIAVHHYFRIDTHLVWDIVAHEVPVLMQQVTEMLRSSEADGSADGPDPASWRL
jgi:uncharacterized protein with HEPN domain